MLYRLFYYLHEQISLLNIFRYITFRAAMAALTAFIISLILGPIVIRKLKALHVGEKITKGDSLKLDEMHRNKADTPTMGGILVLFAVSFSTIIWADIGNKYILISLFTIFWLGVTGFIDDYLKQIKKRSKGLSASIKFSSQLVLGLIIGIYLLLDPQCTTSIDIPFLKDISIGLGVFYVLFVMLVISGSSNAVNLTDGLDGLAIGNVVMVAIALSILSYVSGNTRFSQYLLIPYLPGTGELTVFCASIIGAGLGFLWFNCYPASIFMGDVGALALGGALGVVALLIRKELLLVVVGGILVLEALSVILQVGSFRLRKKRLFKIAPLHHHFQFMGWPEPKVIVRFWIVAALLALFMLVTLKTR